MSDHKNVYLGTWDFDVGMILSNLLFILLNRQILKNLTNSYSTCSIL